MRTCGDNVETERVMCWQGVTSSRLCSERERLRGMFTELSVRRVTDATWQNGHVTQLSFPAINLDSRRTL